MSKIAEGLKNKVIHLFKLHVKTLQFSIRPGKWNTSLQFSDLYTGSLCSKEQRYISDLLLHYEPSRPLGPSGTGLLTVNMENQLSVYMHHISGTNFRFCSNVFFIVTALNLCPPLPFPKYNLEIFTCCFMCLVNFFLICIFYFILLFSNPICLLISNVFSQYQFLVLQYCLNAFLFVTDSTLLLRGALQINWPGEALLPIIKELSV